MLHDEVNDWMACRDWVDSKICLANTLQIVRHQISEENAQNLHLLAPESGSSHSTEQQLAVAHDTIKQVDELLSLARSMETSLQRRRAALEDFELILKSRNAPIANVPAEILALIFAHARDIDIRILGHVTRVNKLWRDIAINRASLWNVLYSRAKIQGTKMCIRRAKHLPLHIRIDASHGFPRPYLHLQAYLRASEYMRAFLVVTSRRGLIERWRSLAILPGDQHCFMPIFDSANIRDLSHLDWIDINLSCDVAHTSLRFPPVVRVQAHLMPNGSAMKNVTHIVLSAFDSNPRKVQYSSFHNMMVSAPKLEHVSIVGHAFTLPVSHPGHSDRAVSIKTLTFAFVEPSMVASLLTLPNFSDLRNISLDFSGTGGPVTDATATLKLPQFRQNIQRLRLVGCFDFACEDWLCVFRTLPWLTEFVCESSGFGDEVLEALLSPSEGGTYLGALLEHLVLRDTDVTCEAVGRFQRTRSVDNMGVREGWYSPLEMTVDYALKEIGVLGYEAESKLSIWAPGPEFSRVWWEV